MASLLVGAVYTWAILATVDRVSVFSGDDVTTSYQARTLPLRTLLLAPIDVHTVPLHRVVTYALAQLSPLNDRAALGVMLTLHAASVWLLYRALQEIERSVANAFVVACYATFVHLGSLFTWWVAAVHRLPYLCCLGGALWAYVVFRRHPSLGRAGVIVALLVAGFGFFEKAVFIPFVLLMVEANLRSTEPVKPDAWKALAALHGTLLALGAAFLVAFRSVVNERMMGGTVTDLRYLAEYSRLSLSTLASAVVGQVDSGAWLGALVLVAVTVGACVVCRANILLFATGAALVWASLIVTALSSARMNLFGLFWTRCWRYYPDVMYVLAICLAIALARVSKASFFRIMARSRNGWVLTAAAVAVLTLLARTSYVHGARAVLSDDKMSRSRAYLDNVRTGVRHLQDPNESPLFADGMVPDYLQFFRDGRARHRVLLVALGVEPRMTRPRRGVYRIDAEGHVVRWQP